MRNRIRLFNRYTKEFMPCTNRTSYAMSIWQSTDYISLRSDISRNVAMARESDRARNWLEEVAEKILSYWNNKFNNKNKIKQYWVIKKTYYDLYKILFYDEDNALNYLKKEQNKHWNKLYRGKDGEIYPRFKIEEIEVEKEEKKPIYWPSMSDISSWDKTICIINDKEWQDIEFNRKKKDKEDK